MPLSSRLSTYLAAVLLLGAGLLMLRLGSFLPLLTAVASLLGVGLAGQRGPRGRLAGWLSTIGALAIFVSGTPIAGSPTEGLLITAVMAIYFICWAQLVQLAPMSAFSPTSPFTLAFYASLFIAYILLSRQLFAFPHITSLALAVLFILTSLALWEIGRRSRLTQASQAKSPSLPDWLGRLCVLLAVLAITTLFFRAPLPWLADQSLQMAAQLNFTADPPSPPRDRGGNSEGQGTQSRDAEGNSDGSGGNADGGPGGMDPWRRGNLPKQADLEMSNMARLHMEILDEPQAEEQERRPVYLRAHALDLIEDGGWGRFEHQGSWIEDQADGQVDGWVTLDRVPAGQATRHRVYLHGHLAGASLVALPNIVAFRGPSVFKQSDDFFSIGQDGDYAYEAVSAPVFLNEVLQADALSAGDALPHYLEKAQGLTFRDIDNLILAPIQGGDHTLKEQLVFIQRWFEEQYAYSLKIENPEDRDRQVQPASQN